MDISVARVTDDEVVESIIFADGVWQCVAEDGFDQSEFFADAENDCWLGVYVDGEIVGIYNFQLSNSACATMHVQILPKFRKDFRLESIKPMWRWFLENKKDVCQKVNITVPKKWPNVYKFAKSGGFIDEGVIRQSYWKNGALHDQWMLGITVREIEEWLDE